LKDERSRASHTPQKEVDLLSQLQALTAQHEAEIARVRNEMRAHHGALEREVSELETALHSRGVLLADVQNELTERDAIVRDLVHQLEEAQRGVVLTPETHEGCQLEIRKLQAERATLVDEVRTIQSRQNSVGEHAESLVHQLQAEKTRADSLAQQAAGREATLQSLQWRIAELEQLAPGAPDSPDVVALQAEIERLRDQLAGAQS
jgi:chromosome segregation ATPase